MTFKIARRARASLAVLTVHLWLDTTKCKFQNILNLYTMGDTKVLNLTY